MTHAELIELARGFTRRPLLSELPAGVRRGNTDNAGLIGRPTGYSVVGEYGYDRDRYLMVVCADHEPVSLHGCHWTTASVLLAPEPIV